MSKPENDPTQDLSEESETSEDELSDDDEGAEASHAKICSTEAPAGLAKEGFSYNRHEHGQMIALDRREHETLGSYIKRFAEVLDMWIMEVPGAVLESEEN